MVYIPVGGLEIAAPVLVTPPHAESTSPREINAIRQLICRSFRDERPRKQASISPANAISAGRRLVLPRGILLLAMPERFVRGTNFRLLPFTTPPGVVLLAQSAALVSIVICPVTGDAAVTAADPLLFNPVPTSTHRFASAVSFVVAYERFTVPVYPLAGVTVTVSFCCEPLFTVRLDGASASLMVPLPAFVPPTVNVKAPVEEAWVASPS